MGSRGPVARPDSSESRRGRNTRFRKGAAPEPAAVKPPVFVKSNPAALAFWREHAPALIASRRLRPEHAVTFGTLAEMAAECRALAERVAAEGVVVETPRGTRANPACRLLRDARRDLFAAARDFGLTALSDARLPIDPVDNGKPDALDEFLTSYP
jgi:phage terminase small subunit